VTNGHTVRISEAASIGMHAMVLLTGREEGLVSTRQIAEALQVSEAHLSKVLQRLAKVGLVASIRGPKGGFRLARVAEEVRLIDVYEAIEGPLTANGCLLGEKVCRGEKCIFGGLLDRIHRQMREYLEQTRLPDLSDVFLETMCPCQ